MALTLTSVARVRREAGLEDTEYIPDSGIELHALRAEGEVISGLLQQYSPSPHASPDFSGSPAEAVVTGLVTEIAVGYVLLEQYEGQDIDMTERAWKRIGSARSHLKAISSGDVRLFSVSGSAFSQPESAQVGAFGQGSDTDRMFTKSQVF